jgi:hypothetical protein
MRRDANPFLAHAYNNISLLQLLIKLGSFHRVATVKHPYGPRCAGSTQIADAEKARMVNQVTNCILRVDGEFEAGSVQ